MVLIVFFFSLFLFRFKDPNKTKAGIYLGNEMLYFLKNFCLWQYENVENKCCGSLGQWLKTGLKILKTDIILSEWSIVTWWQIFF